MREYERREAKDEARIQEKTDEVQAVFGERLIGKIATRIAIDDRPRPSTTVWAQGAVGEERVATQLDSLAEFGIVALHDRKVPDTRVNIDHLVITPWDVWTIDAKRYVGKRPEFYTEGGLFGIGATTGLKVGGRKSDGLVDGVIWQQSVVQAALGDSVTVRGLLCFVDGDWPLIGGDFTVKGVRVCWPKRLAKELLKASEPTIDTAAISRQLASAFPPA